MELGSSLKDANEKLDKMIKKSEKELAKYEPNNKINKLA